MWLGRAMALRNAEHGGSEPRQGDRAAEGEPASRAAFPSTSLRGGLRLFSWLGLVSPPLPPSCSPG